jgi:hypothetical protein
MAVEVLQHVDWTSKGKRRLGVCNPEKDARFLLLVKIVVFR